MHDHLSYKNDFTNETIVFQLDRIRFVLCSYLRTRLKKVCTYPVSSEPVFLTPPSTSLIHVAPSPLPLTFFYSVFLSIHCVCKGFTFSLSLFLLFFPLPSSPSTLSPFSPLPLFHSSLSSHLPLFPLFLSSPLPLPPALCNFPLLPPPTHTHTHSQIEQHVVHVLEWEATQGANSRLSPEELVYAKDFADNMDTHLHSLVLRHMPSNLQRIDRKKAGGPPLHC